MNDHPGVGAVRVEAHTVVQLFYHCPGFRREQACYQAAVGQRPDARERIIGCQRECQKQNLVETDCQERPVIQQVVFAIDRQKGAKRHNPAPKEERPGLTAPQRCKFEYPRHSRINDGDNIHIGIILQNLHDHQGQQCRCMGEETDFCQQNSRAWQLCLFACQTDNCQDERGCARQKCER